MCRQLEGVLSLYVGWGFVCGWFLSLGGLVSFENFVRLMIMDDYDVDLANGVPQVMRLYYYLSHRMCWDLLIVLFYIL